MIRIEGSTLTPEENAHYLSLLEPKKSTKTLLKFRKDLILYQVKSKVIKPNHKGPQLFNFYVAQPDHEAALQRALQYISFFGWSPLTYMCRQISSDLS